MLIVIVNVNAYNSHSQDAKTLAKVLGFALEPAKA